MNKRWWVLGVILFCSLMFVSYFYIMPVEKSQPAKVGILLANDLRLAKVEGLKEGLRRLGYEEGRDLTYKVLNAQNNVDSLPSLAAQLLQDKPDILVAAGAVEAQVLKNTTAEEKTIPVIFMGTLSPVDIGLVSNAAHPAGNLTGLDNYHLELIPKRLELLHRLLPNVHRVAVLGDTRVPSFELTQAKIQTVAKQFSLTSGFYTVSNPEEVKQAFWDITSERVEAIMLLPGFFLEASTKQIVDLALQKKLPVFGVYPSDTEQGCLASYGTSYYNQGEQSAHLVHKVLLGYAPGEIPVETPDKLNFSVNLKTARKLELHPAPSVLSFADQVIQP